MANTKAFIRTVHEKYGMKPLVPFQAPIDIGDIGYLGKDGTWTPV